MSSPLAIAAVTAVLKNLLESAAHQAIIDANIADVKVNTKAPDQVPSKNDLAQINMFMYRVAPNQGWNNTRLPSNNDRGERLTYPPLALDLFYILSVYENDNFQAEILLGYGMQVLHETPVLTRQAIRNILDPAIGDVPIPTTTGNVVTASDLADQVEMIKITLLPLSLDELTKLWSAFQTSYRPSVAYHVSVVLIESKRPARSPLPVLSRGEQNSLTGRDQGVVVQPNLLSPYPTYPTLQEILLPDKQTAIRLSDKELVLHGYHLDGSTVAARFTYIRTSFALVLAAESGNTGSEFKVKLPKDPPSVTPPSVPSPENPDSWLIGFYTLAAVVQLAGEPDPRTTNELPIVLAPRITQPISVVTTVDTITLTVKCSPKVHKTQTVKLIIADCEIMAEPIAPNSGDSDPTENLTFKAKVGSLPSGLQWVRLNIDGVESLVVNRSGTQPKFDESQQVDIP